MIYSNIYFVTCCLISVFYLGGYIFWITDQEPFDKCEMTYMFEYPQFVRVAHDIDKKYPKYSLYAYGEGRITYQARNMDFDGIPVLFIPGNAGSHQQVRSLSSVALRKALNSRTIYHFDYFTVNLNSEYSALYGPVLNEQLEYVNSSLFRVLELYKKKEKPAKQVILIGHSIGGVIAKKLLSTLPTELNLVPIVIALAAPLKRPFIKLDRYLNDFYKMDSSNYKDTNVISIAGGFSDLLIPTYITELDQANALNLVSTNIPKSWVEAQHVQIVWCKQTVLAINRALFDLVDPVNKQINANKTYRDLVLKHHLIYNSGTKIHIKQNSTEAYKIDYRGEWSESILKQYSINFPKGLREPHWYMVGLTNSPGYEILTILAINMDITNWIFACNAAFPKGSSRVCVSGSHLTQYSEIVPSVYYKRRLITLNLHEIKKNYTQLTHIVFRALPTSKPLSYHIDTYSLGERKNKISLPKYSLSTYTIVEKTPEKAIVYEMELTNLWSILQFYMISMEPITCSAVHHHGVMRLFVPWANHHVHQIVTEKNNYPLYLRLQSVRPKNASPAKLILTLDPNCTYRISVRQSFIGTFGQIARYYSPLLITNVAVVVLLAFQSQLKELSETETCPIFFFALKDTFKQYWVLAGACVLTQISNFPYINKILPLSDAYDMLLTANSLLDFVILPLVLYMISICIVFILSVAYSVSIFALESTVHKLVLKLLARSVTFTIRFSDYFMSFLQKVPFVVVGLLIFLCLSTCGGLALCVGMVFYFLRLTQMSQDYIEEVAWILVKSVAKKFKKSIFERHNNHSHEQEANVQNTEAIKYKKNIADISKSICDQGENSDNKDDLNDMNNKADNQENNSKDSEYDGKQEEINEQNTSEQHFEKNEQISDLKSTNETEYQEQKLSTEDNIKNNDSILSQINADFNPIFFHSTLFFIWVMVMLLNIPAVLTWAHNFTYSKVLTPDDSFIPGIVLSVCALPLWHLQLPRSNRKYLHELHSMILVLTVLCLTYATISVYRLNYVLTLTFALVILQQLLAPKTHEVEEVNLENHEQKNQEKMYDDVMKKID